MAARWRPRRVAYSRFSIDGPRGGPHGDEKDVQGVADALEAANDEMADYLREHTTKLLNDVLYTSSNLMHNSFAMSDRWAE